MLRITNNVSSAFAFNCLTCATPRARDATHYSLILLPPASSSTAVHFASSHWKCNLVATSACAEPSLPDGSSLLHRYEMCPMEDEQGVSRNYSGASRV